MRNDSFALPVEFMWKRARAGYRWDASDKGRILYAVDALQPDWQNTFEQYETSYQPLEERTGLFREFAALKPNAEQILSFANRFGLLGAGSHREFDSNWGRVPVYVETFGLWKGEIEAFKLALETWDALVAGSGQALAELKARWNGPRLPFAVQKALHLSDEDPAMAALSLVQRLADERLREHIETRFRFHDNRARLRVSLTPTNLIGALWLQFAAAADGLKKFSQCGRCGAPFEVSRDPRTGKRRDARFCSDRCRVGNYRERIEQARRLQTAGMSAPQIARQLGTRSVTIQRWLADEQRSAPSARLKQRKSRREH
jgi:hypothetical protein